MVWKYRTVNIQDDKIIADSGTTQIDLDVTEPITDLEVRLHCKNGTSTAKDVPPQTVFTKFEIIDGGQVYSSLSGHELLAATCYDLGFWPDADFVERASSTQDLSLHFRFGRYLGDEEFNLVPSKLLNPQLRITWAKNDLHLANNISLGVQARIMEGGPKASKVLFWRAIENWTGGTSGEKRVEMPTDYPYRRMLVRAYESDTVMSACINKLKLDCDLGRFIAFDVEDDEFSTMCRSMFPQFEYLRYDQPDGNELHQMWIGGRTIAIATPQTVGDFARAWASGCHYYYLSIHNNDGTLETAEFAQVLCRGDFPSNAWCYQFGLPDKPETWFDARGYGRVDLKLNEAAAAANAVVVQQVRSLP